MIGAGKKQCVIGASGREERKQDEKYIVLPHLSQTNITGVSKEEIIIIIMIKI